MRNINPVDLRISRYIIYSILIVTRLGLDTLFGTLSQMSAITYIHVQLGLKALTLVRVFSLLVGIQDDLQ